jgi:hypothetical protein
MSPALLMGQRQRSLGYDKETAGVRCLDSNFPSALFLERVALPGEQWRVPGLPESDSTAIASVNRRIESFGVSSRNVRHDEDGIPRRRTFIPQ